MGFIEEYDDQFLMDQGRNDFIETIEKIMQQGPYLPEGLDGEATDLMVRIVEWAEERPALYAIVETANGCHQAVASLKKEEAQDG